MPPKSIVALVCLSLASVAAPPSSAAAAAGEYRVEVCTSASSTGGGTAVRNPDKTYSGSGLAYEGDEDTSHFALLPCDASGHVVLHSLSTAVIPNDSFRFVTLVAPEGARIKEVGFLAPLTRLGSNRFSLLNWVVRRAGVFDLLPSTGFSDDRLFFQSDGGGRFRVEDRTVAAGLLCLNRVACGTPGEVGAVIGEYGAIVLDEFLPGVSGPDLTTRTLRGSANVGFKAIDKGSGIAKVEMLVDGKSVASTSDDNGGKCTTPYKYMQPCKLELESSFALDSTTLPEGQHDVAILATDASGLTRETPPLTVLVHNAPTSLARPVIQGAAKLGASLEATRGEWSGAPTGFAFRWFRCPASVKGDEGAGACRAIPGATDARYVTGKDDLGQRDLVEVTATNSFGSEPRISFPTDVIEEPGSGTGGGGGGGPGGGGPGKPVLANVMLSRKRFRVGGALSQKEKRAAVLAFTCNRGGEVSIAIRAVRRHGKSKSLGKLVAPVKPGRSRILLSGEIGKRRLKPGSYEAIVRVTDQKGTASDPASVRFTIIPG